MGFVVLSNSPPVACNLLRKALEIQDGQGELPGVVNLHEQKTQ